MRKPFLLLILIVPALSLLAQKAALTNMDVAHIQAVSGIHISEDGRHIAFTRSVPADPLKENKPATNTLYLYEVETGRTLPFVTRQSVGGVSFRPKHNSVTFLTRMEGDDQRALYEMSLAGGEATRLFEFETSIASYSWSSDGKRLAFVAREPSEKEKSDLPYEPIVYEGNLSVSKAYLSDLESEPVALQVDGHVSEVMWSPQGDRLAVMAAPSSLVDDYYMKRKIYILSAEAGKVVGEVAHTGKKGQLAWSPDGATLAFIGAADVHDPTAGRLLVVDSRGGEPRNLMPDMEGAVDHIVWQNAKTLTFLASTGVQSTLGYINYDGNGMGKLLEDTEVVFTDMDMAADGNTLVLEGHSPAHPAEAFLWNRNQRGMPERITDSNPWLADKLLGKQETITYQAEDGLELQGILVYPTEYEAGKAYPLITQVHGGPESHYDNGWVTSYSNPGQVAAGEGYVVFYPNYRGSTGRGEAFAKSSQGDLAGKEFDDIVDGVDHLIEMGLVDKDKVGVTGGSYGGYATGWMATRYTERFAAGVMFVGISDNISKWGTSDIPEELFLVHARKRVWDDYEFFLKRSPIYYADQAKTPLLIMAGAEDTRVDPSQSMELYRHIKTRTNTPVSLVLYPGEGHGNRNASARLDYARRAMSWFNTHLKPQVSKP